MPKLESVAALETLRQDIIRRRDPNKLCLSICSGTGCHAYGSEKVAAAFVSELAKNGLQDKVEIRRSGCHGFCERGTIVVVFPKEICYLKVKPEDVPEIVTETLIKGNIVNRLLYKDETGTAISQENEIPFYKHQSRLIFGANRHIDPNNIEDYLALGGYAALAKALFQMTPQGVLEEVKTANLRGRGGGGFPAGKKWETTRNTPSDVKYCIVNADEGDPGAYMDRSILEGNPHSVLEGLIIGAYAIGASEGFVYVRQEYPLAVANLRRALEQAREYGFLGKHILGSSFDFDVTIHRGAGAFVSGESSALMTAIEGRVGEPRPKYIRTSVSGLWGKPSNLNNVETWATVPTIINKGAAWFGGIGTPGSKGTKIFSLVGKVNNTGLVEVPMGTTLRQVIFDVGSGIPGGKRFKAVQIGGPSGGCLPESALDLPIDFNSLTQAGAMMGSGGMIVLDEDDCMVEIARYFLEFTQRESCGKCTFCRLGTKQMLEVLDEITKGRGKIEDLDMLSQLAEDIRVGSLCGLGKTAPNPILTTLRFFRDEYEAHIKEGRCPALMCRDLIAYYIIPERCERSCDACVGTCTVEAISTTKKRIKVIDQEKCVKCGTCLKACPPQYNAVVKLSPPSLVPASK